MFVKGVMWKFVEHPEQYTLMMVRTIQNKNN